MSKHRGGRFKNKRLAGEIMHDDWISANPTQNPTSAMVSDDDAARALAQNHPKSYRPRTYGMARYNGRTQPPQDQGFSPRSGVGGALPIGAFQS